MFCSEFATLENCRLMIKRLVVEQGKPNEFQFVRIFEDSNLHL